MVRPEFAPNVEIPYTSLLRLGRIVYGDVADVRDGRVLLADGSEIPYDFLVVGASFCCIHSNIAAEKHVFNCLLCCCPVFAVLMFECCCIPRRSQLFAQQRRFVWTCGVYNDVFMLQAFP